MFGTLQSGPRGLWLCRLAASPPSSPPTCCLGPLVLVSARLDRRLDRATSPRSSRTGPIVHRRAALVALFFAWRAIFRPAHACKPGEVCAIPQVRTTYKLIFWIVAALVVVALAFPYVLPLFY
jgi:mercuric ion transport protein